MDIFLSLFIKNPALQHAVSDAAQKYRDFKIRLGSAYIEAALKQRADDNARLQALVEQSRGEQVVSIPVSHRGLRMLQASDQKDSDNG